MTRELPTIDLFPRVTRVTIGVAENGRCRLELLAGDLCLFDEECEAHEEARLRDLLEVAARAITGQQREGRHDDGPIEHRRTQRAN